MDRMGHATTRAALIYLHGSNERQQAIAEALSKLTTDGLPVTLLCAAADFFTATALLEPAEVRRSR
jgi:hypothetical protein